MDQPSQKRLTRSTTNRTIGGVAGGLGEYFSIDPTILRILFVVFALWGGSGLAIYIIMWLVIPQAGSEQQPVDERVRQIGSELRDEAQRVTSKQPNATGIRFNGRMIIGGLIVLFGLATLAQQYLPWHISPWDVFMPLVVIAVGVIILIGRK